MDYQQGKFSWTPISFTNNSSGNVELKIGPTKGEFNGQMSHRIYDISLHSFHQPKSVSLNGKKLSIKNWLWESNTSLLK